MIFLWIYLLLYPVAVVIIKEKMSKDDPPEDFDDHVFYMATGLFFGALWPLWLVIAITTKIYEFGKFWLTTKASTARLEQTHTREGEHNG